MMSLVQASPPTRMVRAGAGAGKTTQLVAEIVGAYRQLRGHGIQPRFVVTTFTRKATQELRERLLVLALKENDLDLIDFVGTDQCLLISTLHGVFLEFLRSEGYRIGLPQDLELVTAVEIQQIEVEILRTCLEAQPHLLRTFRFRELLSLVRCYREVRGHNLTWCTDREWRSELRRREERAQKLLAQIRIECAGVPGWEEFLSQLEVIGEAEFFVVLNWLRDFERPKKNHRNARSAIACELFDELREEIKPLLLWTEEFLSRALREQEEFERVARQFSERRSQWSVVQGRLGFADIELLCLDLLTKFPEVGKQFSGLWSYWFIDEFQDTSPDQVEVLRNLIGDRNFFVVGDPQQSIYLFRGAQEEVYQQMWARVQSSGGELSLKMTNYRSRPQVLDFINHHFPQLNSTFQPMAPAREPAAKAPAVTLVWVEKDAGEVTATTARVLELLESGCSPESICILARTRAQLARIATTLREHNVPLSLHGQGQYLNRREIDDVCNWLRFIYLPREVRNILSLARSPWFRVPDLVLSQAQLTLRSQKRNEDGEALWSLLTGLVPDFANSLGKMARDVGVHGLENGLRHTMVRVGFMSTLRELDPSGRREANVFKFLDLLQAQASGHPCGLESALREADRVGGEDAETDAVSSLEPDRVHLMTVHGSKGLQFDHVLVPFVSQPPPRPRAGLLLSTSTHVSLPAVTAEGSREHGPHTQPWLESITEQEAREHVRVFYVATTRARETLWLCGKSKASSGSWAEQLPRETTDVVEVSTLVAAPELKRWTPRGTRAAEVRPPWREWAVDPVEETAARDEKVSVEQILARSDAAVNGIRLHRIFEQIRYGYGNLPEHLEKESEEVLSALEWTMNLSEPPMAMLLREGFAEWGFTCSLSERVERGRIDLWGVVGDQVWIVDYKTGRWDVESGFTQLSRYGDVLRAMGRVPTEHPVHLALIQPLSRKVQVRILSHSFQELQ